MVKHAVCPTVISQRLNASSEADNRLLLVQRLLTEPFYGVGGARPWKMCGPLPTPRWLSGHRNAMRMIAIPQLGRADTDSAVRVHQQSAGRVCG